MTFDLWVEWLREKYWTEAELIDAIHALGFSVRYLDGRDPRKRISWPDLDIDFRFHISDDTIPFTRVPDVTP